MWFYHWSLCQQMKVQMCSKKQWAWHKDTHSKERLASARLLIQCSLHDTIASSVPGLSLGWRYVKQEQWPLPSGSSQPHSHPGLLPSNPFPLHSALPTCLPIAPLKHWLFPIQDFEHSNLDCFPSYVYWDNSLFFKSCLKYHLLKEVLPDTPSPYTLSSVSGLLVNSLSYQCHSPVAYFSISSLNHHLF